MPGHYTTELGIDLTSPSPGQRSEKTVISIISSELSLNSSRSCDPATKVSLTSVEVLHELDLKSNDCKADISKKFKSEHGNLRHFKVSMVHLIEWRFVFRTGLAVSQVQYAVKV